MIDNFSSFYNKNRRIIIFLFYNFIWSPYLITLRNSYNHKINENNLTVPTYYTRFELNYRYCSCNCYQRCSFNSSESSHSTILAKVQKYISDSNGQSLCVSYLTNKLLLLLRDWIQTNLSKWKNKSRWTKKTSCFQL
jgi:hypothetical protein